MNAVRRHPKLEHVWLRGNTLWCAFCDARELLARPPATVADQTGALLHFGRPHGRCEVPSEPHEPPPIGQPVRGSSDNGAGNGPDYDDASAEPAAAAPDDLEPHHREVILEAARLAVELVEDDRTDRWARHDRLVKALGEAPAFLTHEAVASVLDFSDRSGLGIPPTQIIAAFRVTFPGFAELGDDPILVDWSTRAPKKNDDLVLGRAAVVSPKTRNTWRAPGRKPWWRIELSLPNWLANLRDPGGRAHKRLVHHEMCHLRRKVKGEPAPKLRNHDCEEFIETMQLFGPDGPMQEEFIRAGARWLGLLSREEWEREGAL
jgi:hypothetical protein